MISWLYNLSKDQVTSYFSSPMLSMINFILCSVKPPQQRFLFGIYPTILISYPQERTGVTVNMDIFRDEMSGFII